MTISVVGGFLGSVLILLVTLVLSVVSYRRGYDLDSVSTPMVTALGDMGTLPLLYLATFLIRNDAVNAIVAGLCIVVTVRRRSSGWCRPRQPRACGGSCWR